MQKPSRLRIPFRITLAAALVAGVIYADHAVESLYSTYTVAVIDRSAWSEYQEYQVAIEQGKQDAAAHATRPAPAKKTRVPAGQKTSALLPPPTPAKFAQADQIGIFIKGGK